MRTHACAGTASLAVQYKQGVCVLAMQALVNSPWWIMEAGRQAGNQGDLPVFACMRTALPPCGGCGLQVLRPY